MSTKKSEPKKPAETELPRTGMLTRSQFQPYIGYKSRNTIPNLIKAGKFPAGFNVGPNLKMWRAEDIWVWIEENFPRQEWKNRRIIN